MNKIYYTYVGLQLPEVTLRWLNRRPGLVIGILAALCWMLVACLFLGLFPEGL